jgi:molecular chaperone DnaK
MRARARLKTLAERIKIALSTETIHDVREVFISSLEGKPLHLDLVVTRREFEALIEEKLAGTFRLVDRVLGAGKTGEEDIAKILLVGGSTYIPRIFDVLSEERGFAVHREVDPTYAVAIGAAIQGGIIAGEPIDTILVDVNSHSLGIRAASITPAGELDTDRYSVIIHKNTPIPTSMSETFHTIVDNQREARIDAFQGEDPVASKNTSIGSFLLEDLPKRLPAGSEIDVSFAYNLNGIVEVRARERTSGRMKAARFDVHRIEAAGIGPMPEGEREPQDAEGREGMDREKCERILRSARRKISRLGGNPALRGDIERDAALLEQALNGRGGDASALAIQLAERIAGI